MTAVRQPLAALLVVVGIAACTFPPLESPTPAPSPTVSPTMPPTPRATPTEPPTPSADPTPDLGAIPLFSGGEIVATAIDGLRVRQRPGLSSVVIAGLLPLATELEVVMGPIPVDGVGWYLVTDPDAGDPAFREGWIAAGFEPDAFLRPTGRTSEETDVVAAYALSGDAEYGPVEIADEHHAIRWVAVDPGATRCTFTVLLEPADGEPVRAIRATLGNDLVPGTLQPTFFAAQPDIRGQVFMIVESTCTWALAIVRIPPTDEDDATPTPQDG